MKCRHGLTIRSHWYECLDCVSENNPEARGNLGELNQIQRELERHDARSEAERKQRAVIQTSEPRGSITWPDRVTGLVSRTLIALVVAAVLYPIVGVGGCIVRIPLEGHSNAPGHNAFFDPALNSFSTEAVYLPLLLVLAVFFSGLVALLPLSRVIRAAGVVFAVIGVGYLASATIGTSKLRATIANILMVPPDATPASGRKETVKAATVINPDKTGTGRTPNEVLYEFVVPAGSWAQTSVLIEPSQEVLIHHFASNEVVNINVADTTLPPLEKAGTIVPLYTSRNCKNDRPVKSQVSYKCIQMDRPVSIKLFANQTVRVGVLVKAR